MKRPEFDNIYKNEETHFYYRSIRKTVAVLFNKYKDHPFVGSNKKTLSLLDAGCGTGLLVKELAQFGNAEGVDINPHAIRLARKRGVNVKAGSVTNLPFGNNKFDVITSIDVIYHASVESDQKALLEFYRVLKPSGILILRVSGIKWLNLAHDKYVNGARRYNLNEVKKLARKAGFTIEKLSYMNFSLAPLAIVKHFYEKVFPSKNVSHIGHVNSFINKVLTMLLLIEAVVLKYIDFPYGLGIILVARKK